MQYNASNLDLETVAGFGDEWSRFDQTHLSTAERSALFEQYFSVFPWARVAKNAQGFDLGCGSGRWAQCVAPRVGRLHCIDASADALAVAKRNLRDQSNCEFHHASVGNMPLEPGSMDFGYSLGVLHHVPDTALAIRSCVQVLRVGAPFLVYLYYALDNKPPWFRSVWLLSDQIRRVVSRLPYGPRYAVSQAFAVSVYYPLARLAALTERFGVDPSALPLSQYRHRSFGTMRTDALDRFGTRLEQRFSRREIERMMLDAGLRDVRFSEGPPFWCAVGFKA